AVLSFVTVPIITYFVSPDEYGRASMFTLAQSTISAIVYLGMDQAFVREYNEMRDDARKLIVNAMFIPVALVLIVSAIICIFHSSISNMLFGTTEETLAVFALAALLPFMVIENYALLKIRMDEKGLMYSGFTILLKVLILVFTVSFFLLYEKSFRSVVFAAALGEICNGIALYFLVLRKYKFSITLIERSLQERMLKFGLPLVPAFAISWILSSMDKVMLRTLCSYEELGLYSAAFKIVSVLGVLQSCFTLFWTPVAYRWYAEGRSGKIFENIGQTVGILMTVMCMCILLVKNIVGIILGDSFAQAINIFPFLLLYPVLYTLSETTAVGIGFMRKTGYTVLASAFAGASNLLLNWLLIPKLDGVGAAMATGLSYVEFFWSRTLISRRLWYKMKVGKYAVYIILIIINCAAHTFMNGFIPYVITSVTLAGLLFGSYTYIKRNNIMEKIHDGSIFAEKDNNSRC
ncbi:MAG: polysaccharide biosynthesis protein, partial [Clostridiales bacterium]|nr:polysaccharide biosynthesis protein [Clostridiales bacterium]